jgi:hypothetical protein
VILKERKVGHDKYGMINGISNIIFRKKKECLFGVGNEY